MKKILHSLIIFSTSLTFSLSLPALLSTNSSTEVKTILTGDTLFSLLSKNGFSHKERQELFNRSLVPKNFLLVPGHKYLLLQSAQKFQMKIYDHQSDLTYIFWKTSNKIGSHSLKENFKVQTLKINGKIKNSLISSINSKINETLVAYRFMNAFLLDYNLKRDIKKNARFYLIVEKKFDHDYFIKFGNVLIAALEINNKVIKKIFVPFSKMEFQEVLFSPKKISLQ